MRPRFVLSGLLVGATLGFGAGCQRAATSNARALEIERTGDPKARVCGLGFFAEIGGGLVWAVPGGVVGAVAGRLCRRLQRFGRTPYPAPHTPTCD